MPKSANLPPFHIPTGVCPGDDGDGEMAGLDARLSAAQTLQSSGALKWAVLQSSIVVKQAMAKVTSAADAVVGENDALEAALRGGGGDFTTRLWMVALRLLQVW